MSNDPVHVILRTALNLEDGFAFSDETRLQEIPGMDSLAQVRLVMEIERVLDDRMTMDEVIGLESAGNIRELLAARGKL